MRISDIRSLYFVYLLCFCSLVNAQVSVTAVQPPAWKEQDGIKTALFPGDTISSENIIYSGKNSRVLLGISEGSVIELGAETNALLDSAPKTKDLITSAAISILKGAFRYTAGLLSNNRKRDIKISLSTSTIGIRGTDLWGRSTDNEDFVVLIEGDIVINHESTKQVRMREPQSVYTAYAQSQPEPLSKIEVPELLKLAAETALNPNKATLYTDGAYSVVVASSIDTTEAKNLQKKYLEQGYPVENYAVKISGINAIRSQINGFRSWKDANRFRQQISDELDIEKAWVIKRKS